MNDSEEGEILLDILHEPSITDSFLRGGLSEDNNFYLGSFLPESHADELIMWRTYGKDETGSEARGCSVTIDRDFFLEDEEKRTPKAESRTEPSKRKAKDAEDAKSRIHRGLSKVIYFDKATREFAGDEPNDIDKAVRQLRYHLLSIVGMHGNTASTRKDDSVAQAIDRVVNYVITVLRYSFKSADYSYEKEERVIWEMRPRSNRVKIDEAGPLPKRLYVEADKPVHKHISRIVLGPRVVYPERWLYLKVKALKAEQATEVATSQCKFR